MDSCMQFAFAGSTPITLIFGFNSFASVETPVASEYSTNGMEGGMITPRPPATAIRPALHFFSYPRSVRKGTHMEPTAAVVAGPEPEIAP